MTVADDALAQQAELARDKLDELARADFNVFCEVAIRDSRHPEKRIRQAPIHRAWAKLCDENDRLIIWAHCESGKALAIDTPMPTPGGWRTMEDLQVGDEVFASDGCVCRVLWVTETQYGRDVYRVTFDDGSSLLADGEHLWKVKTIDDRGEDPWRVVDTNEMRRRVRRVGHGEQGSTQAKWRVPVASAAQYEEKTLPVHPYVLGAWLGDGHSSSATLTFHEDDRFIFDRCKELEGGDCEPRRVRARPRILYGVIGGFRDKRRNLDRSVLRHRLRVLGVLHNKHVPDMYLRASEEQRRQLLAGLLDTDGTVNRDGHVELCFCSSALVHGALELVNSLGYKARCSEGPAKRRGREVGRRYRIHFTPDQLVFQLPRKAERQKARLTKTRLGRARSRFVVSIEQVPSVPVKCIAVDSADHSYLAGRAFVVTHNSSQLTIARTVWELGRDPNLTFAIVSNTAGQAKKFLVAIKALIERNEDVRRIFPELRPDPNGTWSSTEITVRRTSEGKDPSVQVLGAPGPINGARIDRLILDDILDRENTNTEHMRQELIGWYTSTVPSRIREGGKILMVGTAYHPRDLAHVLAKLEGWRWMRFPVINAKGQVTWPEAWPKERIDKKRIDLVTQVEFARQMLCRARDEATATFLEEWIERAKERGRGLRVVHEIEDLEESLEGCAEYTGVDLAVKKHATSDRTSFFTILVYPNGDRRVLEVDSGKWHGPEIVHRVIDVHDRFGSIVYVESNAAQEYLLQFVQEESAVPVCAHNTGTQKHDPVFGIEGMAVEFANGKWIIPCDDKGVVHPEVEAWINDLLFYSPQAHSGDRLMASWIAREAARKRRGGAAGTVTARVVG